MDSINQKTGELEEGTGNWGKGVEDLFKQWQQGGATQKQVIDAIVEDIKNTENQQDKLNKAALAFGTMGEDGNMKFIESLTSVGKTFEDTKGTMEELNKVKYDDLGSAVEGIKRNIEMDVLEPIEDRLFPALSDLAANTDFSKFGDAAVQGIEGISRISWKDIQKPDKTIANGDESVATGIAQCEGQLVTILDFEKIVAEIAPETSIQVSEIEAMGDRPLCESPILIAEDSILLRRMIDDSLERAGFTNIMNFNNGQEAWDYLLSIRDDNDLYDKVNLVITDIEMPEMDGHRLTKLIKDDPRLKKLPVVIFSSLIDEQMRRKGRELGADEQLAKPEIGHLVSILDELLKKYAQDMGKFQGQKNA